LQELPLCFLPPFLLFLLIALRLCPDLVKTSATVAVTALPLTVTAPAS
jgi:hypothetical protein